MYMISYMRWRHHALQSPTCNMCSVTTVITQKCSYVISVWFTEHCDIYLFRWLPNFLPLWTDISHHQTRLHIHFYIKNTEIVHNGWNLVLLGYVCGYQHCREIAASTFTLTSICFFRHANSHLPGYTVS